VPSFRIPALLLTLAAAAGCTAAQSTPEAPPSFDELALRSESLTFKGTYKVSVSNSEQSVAADYTIYVRPPQYRVDVDGMPATSQSVFVLEDAAYGCQSAGGTTSCVAVPKQAAFDQILALQQHRRLSQDTANFERIYEGAREIAGVRGYCFSVKPKTDSSGHTMFAVSGKICYGAQGLPLLMQTQLLGMDITLEATSFSSQVSDADFKLPAVPTSR
jgi:hypothetical protein